MSGLYRTAPLFVERGAGASFWDVDGNRYLDFNLCDLSMSLGFAPAAVVDAVTQQMARGAHFLLPTVQAVEVAEDLAGLVGLPFWQFTLSASGANTEVLRVARTITGRSKLVIFGGHYHGHLDEAHTFQIGFGGLTRAWRLKSDFVVLGKGLGTGVPFALYGMSAELSEFFIAHLDVDIGPKCIATGGTTYATAVAAAAARLRWNHIGRRQRTRALSRLDCDWLRVLRRRSTHARCRGIDLYLQRAGEFLDEVFA